MGQHYETCDWVLWLAGGGDSKVLRALQWAFTHRVGEHLDCLDVDPDDLDHDACLAFCELIGHGIGLWEGERSYHAALRERVEADPAMLRMAEDIDEEIHACDLER